ncbi:toxin-antitoxin system YwqK family antitoxin [Neisseria iguanae]|uniref:toxin-antitoxin system YwqK family antitoxin n=1 Tax=Neisseria iguanae TaxID=90242 RepID=UPI0011B2880F|nr:hypothetical protein [Neisseria iguanae]
MTFLPLSGCFFVGQIYDKVYEDCQLTSPEAFNMMPEKHRADLAKKCGWKQQTASETVGNNRLSTVKMCAAPVITLPSARSKPDGIQETALPGGLILKYEVKNGKTTDEIKVYYPNGTLETHTRFKNGYAEGWSEGYYPSGKLKTLFLYQKGKIVRYQSYQENGGKTEDKVLKCP